MLELSDPWAAMCATTRRWPLLAMASPLEIRPLSAGANPFRPGDILVTTGTGGVYKPNIPVAIVVALREGYAIGVPLASPSRVEVVMVERAYDANIPPPVAASTTPAAPKAPVAP